VSKPAKLMRSSDCLGDVESAHAQAEIWSNWTSESLVDHL
jgi:hypothetical protein